MIDDAVHAWFQAHRHPIATQWMLVAAYAHSTWGLLIATAGFGGWLAARRQRFWVLLLVSSVPGAMLLNVAVKHLVQRQRPLVDEPLLVLATYSFPSGHAAGATAWYAFLGLWWAAHARSRGQRMAGWVLAGVLVGWVDLSRVYLGVHYLSDVLAGSLLGALWVLACRSLLGRTRIGQA